MDLALHLGMTEAGVRRSMTERELQRWALYQSRRMLPMRRLELQLAQVSLVVARALGGNTTATLQDFLFDPAPEDLDDDDVGEELDAETIATMLGDAKVIYINKD